MFLLMNGLEKQVQSQIIERLMGRRTSPQREERDLKEETLAYPEGNCNNFVGEGN